MRKRLWFLKALSDTLPSWFAVIALIAAVLIAYLSLNQTMNVLTSIAILILVILSVVVVTIHVAYGVLSAKYRHDVIESISNLIAEGDDLRNSLSRYLGTPEDFEEHRKANNRINEWDNRTKKIISDYDPDLVPLITVTEIRGNPTQWVNERNQKLTDLFKHL